MNHWRPSIQRSAGLRHPVRSRGVTLFEMVVVMGVVGILMAVGIPSYVYVTTSNRIAAEINGLLGDLQFARSEAIKEGQTLTVCVSSNGTSCTAGSTSWNTGWIVLSPSYATPLRAQPGFSSTDVLNANNTISAITFNREGFAAGLGANAMLTLHATPVTNATTRCLSIGLIGLMAVQPYDGATCT